MGSENSHDERIAATDFNDLLERLRGWGDWASEQEGPEQSQLARLLYRAAERIEWLREAVNNGRAYRESVEGLPERTLPRV